MNIQTRAYGKEEATAALQALNRNWQLSDDASAIETRL